MAWLAGLKGESIGWTIRLREDAPTIIGRSQHCDIVFRSPSVSREHARVFYRSNRYYLLDENSRNQTLLNGKVITGQGPVPLAQGDRISICDNELEFRNEVEAALESDTRTISTVEYAEKDSSEILLYSQPAEKLARLVQIVSQLTRSFDVHQIHSEVVDVLFKVFPQTDRVFLVLSSDQEHLEPTIIRTRDSDALAGARFSRNLIRRCIEQREPLLIRDTTTEESELSDSVIQSQIHSAMILPLIGLRDDVYGAIQADTKQRRRAFTKEDMQFAAVLANQAAIALENAQQARLQRDLKLAHEIQRGFLPKSVPQVSGCSFVAMYEPANKVGGDYYDFITLPDGRIAITIGDVAGKGVAAALLMAKVSSAARYAFLSEPNPADAVTRLNQQMFQVGIQDKFVTLAAAVYEPQTNRVTLVNAGHNLPLAYRQATGDVGPAMASDACGFPLGVIPDATYQSSEIELAPGTSLMLYTDGVIDARNYTDELMGLDRVCDAIRKPGCTPRQLADNLYAAIEGHAGGHEQADDMTVVVFGRETGAGE